jgi:hypothetical protein
MLKLSSNMIIYVQYLIPRYSSLTYCRVFQIMQTPLYLTVGTSSWRRDCGWWWVGGGANIAAGFSSLGHGDVISHSSSKQEAIYCCSQFKSSHRKETDIIQVRRSGLQQYIAVRRRKRVATSIVLVWEANKIFSFYNILHAPDRRVFHKA